MRIVIAPDSYKECLKAEEVAAAMALGVREICPEAEVLEMPLADGGEGTLDVLSKALCADIRHAQVQDPLGRRISADYGAAGDTAIIEMARVCGISMLLPEERNPLLASTRGLGELIMEAYAHGCRKYIVGLGGSATCDGGAGMLSVSGIKGVLGECTFELLCDVDAPFVGPEGAAVVFAPQKGASEEDVEALECRMLAFARRIYDETGVDVTGMPGAGAAGGLGGALMAYAGAKYESGVDRIMDIIGFDEAARGADLVITGEGHSDTQTLKGKVPYGVLRRSGNTRVALVSGVIEGDCRELAVAGYCAMIQVSNGNSLREDMLPQRAKANIAHAVKSMLSGESVHEEK